MLLLAALFGRRRGDWRVGALEGATVWGVFLALATEVLSLFREITVGWVALAWAALAAASAWLLHRSGSEARGSGERPASEGRTPKGLRPLCVAVAILLAVVALVGLIAAPNNWDSLAYHLPRVVQWIQAQDLRHYPTPYLAQLEHPPFAELVILHFQLLSGGDRFAASVQWLGFLGSVVGVSVIARQLGAGARGQVFAAVVAATLPMAILQGSSTQNDDVLAFWLIAFAVFARRALDDERVGPGAPSWLGATLGLALLTKATSYFFAAPFVAWLAIAMIRRLRWRAAGPAVALTAVVLLLNAGHFARNIALIGTPMSGGGSAVNELRTPAAFASVVIRNLALHVGTPFTPVNDRIDAGIRAVHGWLGLDVNDSRTTCWGRFWINKLNTYEDAAGNPIHLALVVAALVALAWRGALRGRLRAHALATGAGFLLFCLMLKYQPWHSRLHTPLFLLFAPLVGSALEGLRWRRLGGAVAIALLVASVPWLVVNRQRPLLDLGYYYESILRTSRLDQYFTHPDSRHLRDPYVQAAEVALERGGDVGLLLPEDAFEYPLWVLLEPGKRIGRLDNVGVTNISARATRPGEPFRPATILRLRENYYGATGWGSEHKLPDADPALDVLQVADGAYTRLRYFGTLDVFVRQPAAAPPERGSATLRSGR